MYKLFEDGEKIYSGGEPRFEKKVTPGIEYCYAIKASSDFGLKEKYQILLVLVPEPKYLEILKLIVFKNTLTFKWSYVNGAVAYNIYRDDEKIATVNDTAFQDINLEYDKEYYYKITAVDGLNKQSDFSIELKALTHKLIEAPILSSIDNKKNITLIWNDIEDIEYYNIYRDGILISFRKWKFIC